MKIVDNIKFDKPTNILTGEDEICKLFEGDIELSNIETKQNFLEYYYKRLREDRIEKEKDSFRNNLTISADNNGVGYNYSVTYYKDRCLEMCFDCVEDDIISPALDALDDGLFDKVSESNGIKVTKEMIEREEKERAEYDAKVMNGEIEDATVLLFEGGLERVGELLESYSITCSGYTDEDSCDDIIVKQNFKIVSDGEEYRTAEELPDKYDTLVLSTFFQYMYENVSEFIVEGLCEDISLEYKLNELDYLDDYSYIDNHGKELEDTDFYKWFEENKIFISEDKKYWIIDEQ